MYILVVAIFVLGYSAIIFEHPLKINKTAPALITGVLCWTVVALGTPDVSFFQHPDFMGFLERHHNLLAAGEKPYTESIDPATARAGVYPEFIGEELAHHLAEIAQILFFLIGAMTIVEMIDINRGFKVVTDRIRTKSSQKLLWTLGLLAFFMSALLDNLTTSIVMVSLLRKLISDREQRIFFCGLIVIAANAGGAWSPIGDVTTTMLWIGGQITAGNIITSVFLPSLVCMALPFAIAAFQLKGARIKPRATAQTESAISKVDMSAARTMLITGVSALIFVPIFKTVTHLPPYMGMLLGAGVVWIVSEVVNGSRPEAERYKYTATYALSKIDVSSVLFFFGILAAIAALQSLHLLSSLAGWMNDTIGNLDVIVVAIGIASAIVDNVPLVAASMGMYDLSAYPTDVKLWEFLAYCAGTGGSVLIIGSAAGVAVMGMENIDFVWYVRRISLLALLGYLAGAGVYLLQYSLLHG